MIEVSSPTLNCLHKDHQTRKCHSERSSIGAPRTRSGHGVSGAKDLFLSAVTIENPPGAFLPNRYYSGPVTDHFDGKQFYHPGLPSTDKSLLTSAPLATLRQTRILSGFVPARFGLKPERNLSKRHTHHLHRPRLAPHSDRRHQHPRRSRLVRTAPAPSNGLGPVRHNPPAVSLADLPPIHAVLVTHNHYDHMDTATLAALHGSTTSQWSFRLSATTPSSAKTRRKSRCKPATGGKVSRCPRQSKSPSFPPTTGRPATSAIAAWLSGVALFSTLLQEHLLRRRHCVPGRQDLQRNP